MKKYVVDTSALIEKQISDLVQKNKIDGTIIIPHAVVAELENQANHGLEIGFLGLEELQTLQKIKKKTIVIEFKGDRPNELQIKYAKSGEIDASIRDLAHKEKATLITADKVLNESAKAFGIPTIYFNLRQAKEILEFEKYFDKNTMSVHIKEDCVVYAKRGKPGHWNLEKITQKKLTGKEIEDMSKEIVEKSRISPDMFIEISRKGSTVIQYRDYRIVVVRPPVSDGWEITVVRPIEKLALEQYQIEDKVLQRMKEKASGILIVGETGSGKSTFGQALAEFYQKNGAIVKTLESPRDLQVINDITQYNKNFASSEEIHDILLLSRPDYILFDEVRDTPDFKLYIDLKLGASNVIGVIHAATPIDAIQRFVSRAEVGMIPSVVDTILFIQEGKLAEVYTLELMVKVPSGMTESDLARPVIEVRDFKKGVLLYEIYSYGEETVVIPIKDTQGESKGALKLAEKEIERHFRKYVHNVRAEMTNQQRARVYVPEQDISRIIGSGGKTIEQIENQLGISIEVRELEEEKCPLEFTVDEDKKSILLFADPGRNIEVLIDGRFLFSAITSKKGLIKVHKKSNIGRELLKAMDQQRKIEVKG